MREDTMNVVLGTMADANARRQEALLKLLELVKSMLLDSLQDTAQQNVIKAFEGHVKKGGALKSHEIPMENCAALTQMFETNHIPYVAMASRDIETGENMAVFMTRDIDSKIVDRIRLKFINEHRSGLIEMPVVDFLEKHNRDNIGVRENFTAAELEIFRFYMADSYAPYAVIQNSKDDTYQILYPLNSTTKVEGAIKKMAYDFAGPTGKAYKQALEEAIKLGNKDIAYMFEKDLFVPQRQTLNLTGLPPYVIDMLREEIDKGNLTDTYAAGNRASIGEDDLAVAEKILATTIYSSLSGIEHTRARMRYEGRGELDLKGKDAQYIVNADLPGYILKLDKMGISIYIHDELNTRISREDPGFTRALNDLIENFPNVVVLTEKEFNSSDKNSIIRSRLPQYQNEELRLERLEVEEAEKKELEDDKRQDLSAKQKEAISEMEKFKKNEIRVDLGLINKIAQMVNEGDISFQFMDGLAQGM